MRFFSVLNFKRAVPLGMALFFASTGFASKVETYQDVIEKAYNLSLQKDRTQAVNLLVNAIRKESKKGQPPKELLTSLEEVSTIFYSDKAQQLHELALSLRTSDVNLAQQKLTEASRLEPENQQVALEQFRLSIAQGDCESTLKNAKKWREKNPYSETVRLVTAQAALCSGSLADYQELRQGIDLKKTGHEIYWQNLDLEMADRSGTFSKGKELATQFQKSDTTYPESYYWLWKFGQGMKSPDERAGQKYLAACKSLSSRLLRQYSADPRLCRRVAEVESELKKTNPAGEQ